MRPPAQLHRIRLLRHAPHAQHAHLVAILLAKQRHRPRRNRIIGRHQPRRYRGIGANLGVYDGFNRSQVLSRKRGGVRIIKPQPIMRNQAALLHHMAAQPVPQRLMQQVRR